MKTSVECVEVRRVTESMQANESSIWSRPILSMISTSGCFMQNSASRCVSAQSRMPSRARRDKID